MTDNHIRRMVTELPLRQLPVGIVRWRVNRKRDDGTWQHGDWAEGAPPTLPDDPRGGLLEYDMRTLSPPRVTVLGDSVQQWTDGVLAARIPNLNPWSGVAVVALHSHTADQPCDDRCSVYDRTDTSDPGTQ